MHNINVSEIDAVIFDFDGVLTDNNVYVDSSGNEQVCCYRGDGLAFDVFRKLGVNVCIFSTEKNLVVTARAKKLQVPVYQSISNKLESLDAFVKENNYKYSNLFYIGNDLNDYLAMKKCGFSACPSDSHSKIKEISTFQLRAKGGCGVARELIESVFKLDIIKILYLK